METMVLHLDGYSGFLPLAKLPMGMFVSVNVCLSLYVSRVIDW